MLRLRSAWRKGEEPRSRATDPPTEDEEGRRERDALDANDRIRAEAPDDLETRRRADQLEREIRKAHDSRDSSHRAE